MGKFDRIIKMFIRNIKNADIYTFLGNRAYFKHNCSQLCRREKIRECPEGHKIFSLTAEYCDQCGSKLIEIGNVVEESRY